LNRVVPLPLEIMLSFSAFCLLVGLFWLPESINAGPVPSISLRGSSEPPSLKMPFTKRLSKKGKMKRDGSVVASLLNEVVSYDITIEVGTPAQTVNLQLDTGSSDLWVLAPGACDTTTCTCPSGGCTYCMYIGLTSRNPSMLYVSFTASSIAHCRVKSDGN
jgi:hypothetical protein